MDSREMQQQLYTNQGSMSPIRRSAIFRTATIRPPSIDSPTLSGTSEIASATGSFVGNDVRLQQSSVDNSPVFNEYPNAHEKSNMIANCQLDLDLDCGLFSNLESSKLFEYDPFGSATNDSADTYVESFRLNSGTSEEDETMSIEDSIFQPQNLKSYQDVAHKSNLQANALSKSSVTQSRGKPSTKPTPARTEPRQGRRASTLVLADLERYYTQPLAEASKALGLSATMLKKVCRSFGIRRWPHRQLASIDRTITRVRQRLAVQERTHFYSLDGDCRASAALRNKVAQLEIKKDAICRLTSRGMSLHNVTKSKNPEKVIMEELGGPLNPRGMSHSVQGLLSNTTSESVHSTDHRHAVHVQDRLENNNIQNSWDIFGNSNDFPAQMRNGNSFPDHSTMNFQTSYEVNGNQRHSSMIAAPDQFKAKDDNLFLNFNDLNLTFQTQNDYVNNGVDQATSADGFFPTSSPWSAYEDPFNLFFPNDSSMGNPSGSEYMQPQGCLF